MQTPKLAELAKACDISVSYASQILSGSRSPSQEVAIRIFNAFGLRLGALAHLDDAEARTVAELLGRTNTHAATDTTAAATPSPGKGDDISVGAAA